MARLSFLQMYDAKHWGGLTTQNHLGSIFSAAPQKASKLITAIHDTNFGIGMDSLLSRFDTVTMDTDDDFTWELIGTARRNVPLVEARVSGAPITPTSTPGINNTYFELVFGEKWFSDEQLIVGHANEKYPIKIVNDPYSEGTNWVYTCVLLSGNPEDFVDPEELEPGKRFSADWSPVETTLSKKGSDINFVSPFGMRNSFTMIRMQHTTPGNMINRPFGSIFKDPKGKIHKIWTQYADYQFEEKYYREKNRLLMFATSNRGSDGVYRVKGKSGYEIKQGAGIRQQMEVANTQYYTDFSIDIMTDILMDLSEGRSTTDQRNFVAKTGERGSTKFHKSIENYTTLYTPLRVDNRVYKASSSVPHTMGMGYGGQFVEFKAPNAITIGISVDSMYDDRERNKIFSPDGGVMESHRFDIMDLGTTEGERNIRKVMVAGQEDIAGYEPGFRDPFSPTGARSRIMANATDGYTIHRGCVMGAMVKDPTKTASLIPNFLA